MRSRKAHRPACRGSFRSSDLELMGVEPEGLPCSRSLLFGMRSSTDTAPLGRVTGRQVCSLRRARQTVWTRSTSVAGSGEVGCRCTVAWPLRSGDEVWLQGFSLQVSTPVETSTRGRRRIHYHFTTPSTQRNPVAHNLTLGWEDTRPAQRQPRLWLGDLFGGQPSLFTERHHPAASQGLNPLVVPGSWSAQRQNPTDGWCTKQGTGSEHVSPCQGEKP